ncbi:MULTISPECIES: SPOR domain-containing protein [Stenotrophomonas]|jgi:cell division protein FtsN|uniref:SPOR domain-containing protein n=1 Tax=Stenotrophomonas maltophilia TaxID=40324 RepID=A0AA41CK55_STEMA|nr:MULTISPECIES: SPOR domain-containing protein [Stenotrophomonas]AWB76769.1 sporulation protein [Stenotrophomonas maltophilia]KOO85529.1 sporulation protein [Stenotrophomonas maltophilia]MBH1584085.1 SPOR domain-containing protein [Stenotrophomonas maltophilia]MBH1716969.1 SPOR domain-containing protein [Stenotrophomonas maltophilia]MBH1789816.1 SPOR domain-containing protein [Stenotrophomonas maltophilia]
MAARRGKTQARRNSSSQGTPGWVWLVAGVAIAAVVFLAAPNLFKGEGDGFLRAGPQPNPNAQPAPVADADSDVGSQPAAQPATPKPAEPEKPAATQYDFYTLLPGKEVEMSDAELAASARAEDQRRAKAEASRAQAALEGKPVPPASTATPAPTATASVVSTAPVTASNRPLPAPLSERPAAATPPASTAPASTSTAAAPAPRAEAAPTAPATTAAPAPADNARYILQAGAFGASGDAEATKAKLAMMGLAARVESAQINGKTVYRVRMGPYGSAGELSEAKQKLDGTGLQAMAIKAQ